MRGIDQLARGVRGILRRQRAMARRGKERFGDWNPQLAEAIRDGVAALYLSAARGAKAKAEHAELFVSLARVRALEVARAINRTTGDWITEGRDDEVVFGDSRVASIAETEATHAKMAGIVAVSSDRKLRWVASPGCCKKCKKFGGRTVMAGSSFGVVDGREVFHPGLHPFCKCKLEVR
jgi:hypothetical protein